MQYGIQCGAGTSISSMVAKSSEPLIDIVKDTVLWIIEGDTDGAAEALAAQIGSAREVLVYTH